ncbi:hypothetical protein HY989_00615 [Candidatus Micrarchaeota archaeon]|nr:hypothetical protein [Candidatus Micrarchaeota archaeon]
MKQITTRGILEVLALLGLLGILLPTSAQAAETFTIKLEIADNYHSVVAGDEIWFTTKVFNHGAVRRMDVTLKFDILDGKGFSVKSKTKTIAVETQVSDVDSMAIPIDLKEGNYAIRASITSLEKDYSSEESFGIKGLKNEQDSYILFAIPIFVLLSIGLLLNKYLPPYLEKRSLRNRIRGIVSKRIGKK